MSVKLVVLGASAATRAEAAPPPCRQTAKAASLSLLSVQVRFTWDDEAALAVSPLGAAGAVCACAGARPSRRASALTVASQ